LEPYLSENDWNKSNNEIHVSEYLSDSHLWRFAVQGYMFEDLINTTLLSQLSF
jgi:hypothetical protein